MDFGEFLSYFERHEVPERTVLVKQGGDSDSLLFVEFGEVSVILELETGRTARLRWMSAGTVVGEIGFFQGGKRTATVVAEKPCVYFMLTTDGLKKLEEDPVMARSFHNRTLQAILD